MLAGDQVDAAEIFPMVCSFPLCLTKPQQGRSGFGAALVMLRISPHLGRDLRIPLKLQPLGFFDLPAPSLGRRHSP